MELLIENSANINEQDDAGRTPLFTAAEAGNNDIVRFLIEKKANVNIANKNGTTPLHIIASKG